MTMLDPRNASVVFTPMDLKNQNHPTIGRLMILPTADVATALDAPAEPGDHVLVARPPQRSSYAEAVPVVPDGETDPMRGALLTAVRLIQLDGLEATNVLGNFGARIEGWSEAVADGRVRQGYRVSR